MEWGGRTGEGDNFKERSAGKDKPPGYTEFEDFSRQRIGHLKIT